MIVKAKKTSTNLNTTSHRLSITLRFILTTQAARIIKSNTTDITRPLRWGLAFLWALRGQCCVGGICDSKIKEIWWFTTKVCPTLRVPIGVLNSPRGITIHIYKFCVFGPPRPNHNKPNEILKKLNEHQEETNGKRKKIHQIHPGHHNTHL